MECFPRFLLCKYVSNKLLRQTDLQENITTNQTGGGEGVPHLLQNIVNKLDKFLAKYVVSNDKLEKRQTDGRPNKQRRSKKN